MKNIKKQIQEKTRGIIFFIDIISAISFLNTQVKLFEIKNFMLHISLYSLISLSMVIISTTLLIIIEINQRKNKKLKQQFFKDFLDFRLRNQLFEGDNMNEDLKNRMFKTYLYEELEDFKKYMITKHENLKKKNIIELIQEIQEIN